MGDVDPKAIAAFVLVTLASPVLGYWAHALIAWHKTRKAHDFLDADPLVFVGARFSRLMTPDGAQLLGAGRVELIERGRVLVSVADGTALVPFTGVEFQSMYPLWLDASAPSAPPARLP
ncbi:MAG: hypothetical protein OXN96_19065 [Bryobacterales bacterium]|nr:hypothetical protein [Bryobacterales bacterium]